MALRTAPIGLVLALSLLPASLRGPRRQPAPAPCIPEGRGLPPREWLGCATDPGPRRDLSAAERLALELPVDVNTAGEAELAYVPGLTRRLAAAIVEHRRAHGPFGDVAELRAVRGIGPRRLQRAHARLFVGPPTGQAVRRTPVVTRPVVR